MAVQDGRRGQRTMSSMVDDSIFSLPDKSGNFGAIVINWKFVALWNNQAALSGDEWGGAAEQCSSA